MKGKELPDLSRLCVVADGRIKANFSDNSVLLLSNGGNAFTLVGPDGQHTRQLSDYALTRHSPLVAAVLGFRNMHLEEPYFCKPLARSLQNGFTLGYAIKDAVWPSHAEGALQRGLVEAYPDGKVAVSSEDRTAQVVLHYHRRRFAVCYPLLVEERQQLCQYEYVWHTQVFSMQSYPPRWDAAVRIALEVSSAVGHEQHAMRAQPPADGSGVRPGEAPQHSAAEPHAHPAAAAQRPPQRISELPTAGERACTGFHESFPSGSWWQDTSLSLFPSDDVLLFEWTPHATYQYLPEQQEVEVWVHQDESCLASVRAGRFWAHYKDASSGEQLYAANCVPEYVWSRDEAGRYALGQLAAHAMKLREHAVSTLKRRALQQEAGPAGSRAAATAAGPALVANPHDEHFAAASTEVLEESVVVGQGHFTAYKDGRVRICFEDRTILHLSANHAHAKAILPDGMATVVATANPVGVEGYVRAAYEFCAWAFRTPAERSQALRLQGRIQAELHASQRMAAMCEFGLTQEVPVPVSQQLLGIGSPEKRLEMSLAVQGAAHEAAQYYVPPDRQRMIEEMLQQNALLLQRL